jgi:hypothetical protein
MRVRESPPLRGEPIDVGGANVGRAVATEVAIAEIVGVDQDDVGARRWLVVRGSAASKEEKA